MFPGLAMKKIFKSTALAHSNLAFIKYWGKKNEKLKLPANSSLSVNLSNLYTITTVEFSEKFLTDEIKINQEENQKESLRVVKHLDLIRKKAGVNWKAKVVSQNNFPKAAGFASSASGFAALTLAATKALELSLSEKELTILARLGSGSACRSIPDGFVEWRKGKKSEDSYAYSIFPSNYWKISIFALVLKISEKKISSSEGHRLAPTNPFFKTRLERIEKKIFLLKEFIKKKDFLNFGQLIESEALELHAIMFTSQPSLIYWDQETIRLIKFIYTLREKRLPVYFSIDAGPNPYFISEEKYEKELLRYLKTINSIKEIIINHPGSGAKTIDNHLF
jgi:diphosphomevalonate decarboxylase